MNKLALAACACAAISITSCQTVQQTADTVGIDAKVVQVPTVADLDVQPQRVTSTQTWRWRFLNVDQLSLGQRKLNLIYDMVNEAKADVLVEPQVRFTKKFFGERSLTISGYPASYKNFRKPTAEDLKAIRAANGTPEKVVVVGDSAHIARATDNGVRVAPVRARNGATPAQHRGEKMGRNLHFFVRAAANFNKYKFGDDLSEIFDSNLKMGYDVTLGLQKAIKGGRFYYGPELGVTSRGFQLEYTGSYWGNVIEYGGLSHGVFVSPLNFGFQQRLSNKLTLDAHVGLPVTYYYCDDIEDDGMSDDYDGWDFNMKLGVGVWIKRFNIDLSYRHGFLETWGEGQSNNVMLGLGYRF